jgi:hypothetical protein
MGLHRDGRHAVSRRSAARMAGLAALSAGLGAVAAGTRAGAQSSSTSGIVGSWRVRIPSGLVNRVDDIQFLMVFIPGGVFLNLDSPVELPADRTAAMDPVDYQGAYAGQWLQLPSGEVRATALQLNYDRRAVVTSEEVVSYTITFDGSADTIAGTWEWRETASDGRPLFASTGPFTGTRVKVES